MGTLEIIEHLYPEKRWISYTIKGKNLWGIIFKKYIDTVEYVLEISGSKIYQRYLMVDDFGTWKGGSSVDYRFYVDFRKPWDKNTNFWIKTKLNGWQDLKTQKSEVTFKFQPFLRIKFNYVNAIQKSLIDLYWYTYYQKRVFTLKEQNKKLFEKMWLELKMMLGVDVVSDKRMAEAWREAI